MGDKRESWVPKARTTGMRREVRSESAGKDHRDKEGKKGKRRKTILSLPNGDLERSTVVEREYGDKLETSRKVSRGNIW